VGEPAYASYFSLTSRARTRSTSFHKYPRKSPKTGGDQSGLLTSGRAVDLTADVNNGFVGTAAPHIIPALLWFANIAWVTRVTLFVRQRAGSEFAAVDVAAGIQVLIVLGTMLVLIVSGRLIPMLSSIARRCAFFLVAYYSLSAISSVWSAAPLFSMYRAIEFITMFMAVMVALSYRPNFIDAEKGILGISLIVIILSTEVSYFSHATSRITALNSGFRHGLSESWQSLSKPSLESAAARDRRTSAKAYSVVFLEAYRRAGACGKCAA